MPPANQRRTQRQFQHVHLLQCRWRKCEHFSFC